MFSCALADWCSIGNLSAGDSSLFVHYMDVLCSTSCEAEYRGEVSCELIGLLRGQVSGGLDVLSETKR